MFPEQMLKSPQRVIYSQPLDSGSFAWWLSVRMNWLSEGWLAVPPDTAGASWVS